MHRGLTTLLGSLALIVLVGCGSDTTTQSSTGATSGGSGTTTSSLVTATVSPSPAIAVVSSDASYSWSTSFTVTLAESKGVGVRVQSLKVDLQQAAGGIVIEPPTGFDESFRFNVSSPSNRVEANASLAVGFTFFYTLPNGGREALVTVTFTVVDDNGSAGTVRAELKVA